MPPARACDATGARENAERDHRRCRHCDEVPVEVDQRVHEVGGRSRHERDGRRALRSREATERADAYGDAREDHEDEEAERDDASVRELLQRNAVRLGDAPLVRPEALARDLERARARTLR